MASQGIGKFDSQARLTVDAWNRCIGFCNEQTWMDEEGVKDAPDVLIP
jgi:hypothetical protein